MDVAVWLRGLALERYATAFRAIIPRSTPATTGCRSGPSEQRRRMTAVDRPAPSVPLVRRRPATLCRFAWKSRTRS